MRRDVGGERRDAAPRVAYYWLAILIIRTGATNIADFLAFRVRVPQALLAVGLIALIAAGAVLSRRGSGDEHGLRPPNTNGYYWLAMLGAGVFGTVVGDVCSHALGEGVAAVGLTAVLLAVLVAGRGRWTQVAVYWSALAVARTAGTALGDWLAENPTLHIGLLASTVLTTLTFVTVAVLRQRGRGSAREGWADRPLVGVAGPERS
ncbi:hypothetical protein tb265_29870 [Gemmatimonadetes bacterium T265]|nr:hypothetical protein tb265_29870 [Gemmatimonadetes bacterium T265]